MFLLRFFGNLLKSLVILGLLAGIGVVSYLLFELYLGDYTEYTRDSIMKRISAETSVYYRDGRNKIGVFFSQEHRTYIPIAEMPGHLLNAIISAEDYYFYRHPGINPFSLMRAAIAIAKARRIVQGGSTLTQQTAKNLFHRRERSFKAKFIEMIQALKLERRFSKKDILEFYLNQFHVVGNGRGIGIAAKYYFDKDVRDLTLVESAFIAGSVKGPFKYDPRSKKTEQSKAKARKEARIRKDWVLRRMLQNKTISQEEYNRSFGVEIPYNYGTFRYKAVSILDYIRKKLSQPEILEALGYESVDEIITSGLKIITTLDADVQKAARYHVRKNLSRVEHLVKGFSKGNEDNFVPVTDISVLDERNFYYAKIIRLGEDEKGQPQIYVSYGSVEGIIPYAQLVSFGDQGKWFVDRRKLKEGEKPYQAYLRVTLEDFKEGDYIYTSIVSKDPKKNQVVASLEVKPEVEGGLITIEKGDILALVSGFSTNTYNRAVYAKRQPGSVFKPFVFYGALQLGWNIMDPLRNVRTIYSFGQDFYFPKPDHPVKSDEVSMVWAGAKSENLASIHLLVHMTDKLRLDELQQLAMSVDMAHSPDEDRQSYIERVRDKLGIIVNPGQIKRYLFPSVVSEILPDIIFNQDRGLVENVSKMHFGLGFTVQIEEYLNQLDPEYVNQKIEDGEMEVPLPKKEIIYRINALQNNYLRYEEMLSTVQQDMQVFYDYYHVQKDPTYVPNSNSNNQFVLSDETVRERLQNYFLIYVEGQIKRVIYMPALPAGEEEFPASFIPLDINNLLYLIGEEELKNNSELVPTEEEDFFAEQELADNNTGMMGDDLDEDKPVFDVSQIYLDDRVPGWVINQLKLAMQNKYEPVWSEHKEDLYSIGMLSHHRDFRILVGLRYLIKLAKLAGISSHLSPILSFPLGANEVTLAESAKLYQLFLKGRVYTFGESKLSNQVNIIKQIEDRYGNKLYTPSRKERQIVDSVFSSKIFEVLRKTMTQGTGISGARRVAISLDDYFSQSALSKRKVRVPTYGKTGTTNDYINSTFVGFLPYPTEKDQAIDPSNAYVMAAYVGYDKNYKMVNKPVKITGAQGALPIWAGVAKEIVDLNKYADYIDIYDLTIQKRGVYPIYRNEQKLKVKVDSKSGIVKSVVTPDQFDGESSRAGGHNLVTERNMVHVEGHIIDDQFKPMRIFKLFKDEEFDSN